MPPSLPCPRCSPRTLVLAEHGAHAAFACTRCAGVWLDPQRAAQLLAPLTDLRDRFDGCSPKRCPACGKLMGARYSGLADVEVGRCLGHGVWLDRDVVEGVATVVTRTRGGPPPPPLPALSAQTLASGANAGTGVARAALAVGAAAVALDAFGGSRGRASDGHSASGAVLDGLGAAPGVAELAGATVDWTATAAGEAAGPTIEALSGAVDVGELASGAAEVGGTVLEGAGEAAGTVLEGIAELLGGLL